MTDSFSIPERCAEVHKGDFGRVLVIGGSLGMAGAVSLAGSAALKTGSGLVKLAVPKSVLNTVASFVPEYMTIPLPEDTHGRLKLSAFDKIMQSIAEADVTAIGPGLGRSVELDALLVRLNRVIEKPLIIDADGLNALSSRGIGYVDNYLKESAGPRILTPHPGEFARLTGRQISSHQEERVTVSIDFAKKSKVILVLKGHRTIVTDGENVYINQTGNPGLAAGGSGDVLTGMIASFAGQKFPVFKAAKYGVYYHGRAADLAMSVDKNSICHSLSATDLIAHIQKAVRVSSEYYKI